MDQVNNIMGVAHPHAEELRAAGYELHALAALFPAMHEEEFRALKEAIRLSGQREPALRDMHGRILDGVHRVRACVQLGIQPRFEEFDGDEQDAQAHVLDLNLHRRHLSTSQRAMIAAGLCTRGPGRPSALPSENPADLPDLTQAEAAAALNVSERLLRDAKAIITSDDEEMIEAVKTGGWTVNAALREVEWRQDIRERKEALEREQAAARQAHAAADEEEAEEEEQEPAPTCDGCGKEVGEADLYGVGDRDLCVACGRVAAIEENANGAGGLHCEGCGTTRGEALVTYEDAECIWVLCDECRDDWQKDDAKAKEKNEKRWERGKRLTNHAFLPPEGWTRDKKVTWQLQWEAKRMIAGHEFGLVVSGSIWAGRGDFGWEIDGPGFSIRGRRPKAADPFAAIAAVEAHIDTWIGADGA